MGFFLDIYVEYLARVVIRLVRQWNAGSWEIQKAEVTTTDFRRGGIGCAVADVRFTYQIDGKVYSGTNAVPFISDRSAKDYVEHYSPNSQIVIRVNPDKPALSVVRESDLYWVEHRLQLETK